MSDLDLTNLPGAALYSIARNESAEPRYRKAAVRLMLKAKSLQVNHPDLAAILSDVRADMAAESDVVDIVEQAVEEPIHTPADELPDAPGPFRASFTTKSM